MNARQALTANHPRVAAMMLACACLVSSSSPPTAPAPRAAQTTGARLHHAVSGNDVIGLLASGDGMAEGAVRPLGIVRSDTGSGMPTAPLDRRPHPARSGSIFYPNSRNDQERSRAHRRRPLGISDRSRCVRPWAAGERRTDEIGRRSTPAGRPDTRALSGGRRCGSTGSAADRPPPGDGRGCAHASTRCSRERALLNNIRYITL